jgi:hypothetical protein
MRPVATLPKGLGASIVGLSASGQRSFFPKSGRDYVTKDTAGVDKHG